MSRLVTVIIPFFNEEAFIQRSVQCIIDQTYRQLDILLVNDCSTDDSLERLRRIKDRRIRIISNITTMGVSISRNIGIEQAKGDYVACMDADDECDSTRIEKQLGVLLRSTPNTVCGTWTKFIESGKHTIKRLPTEHADIIKGFRRRYNRVTFVSATLMCRKALLRQFKYRERFKYFEDWDLLLRLYESGSVVFRNVAEPLYSYIVRDKSTKYRTDWYDYNVFARNCQHRRRHGQPEFESIEEFARHLKINVFANAYYEGLKSLIRLKRHLEERTTLL